MAKTMTVEEFEATSGRDILDEAREFDGVVVKNDKGTEIAVVQARKRPMDEVLAELDKEWDERLAVLNEPGAEEKTLEIFRSTPEEFAAAANAAEAERRRR